MQIGNSLLNNSYKPSLGQITDSKVHFPFPNIIVSDFQQFPYFPRNQILSI